MTEHQPWEAGFPSTTEQPRQAAAAAPSAGLDPQNPFENSMENPAYRMDYRRTLPQILLPGFQIPLFPEWQERKAIRKSFNIAGFWLCVSCMAEQLLFTVFMMLILVLMGVAPGEYSGEAGDKAVAYFNNSSLLIALNGLLYSLLNTGIAMIGCKRLRVKPGSLFQAQDFGTGKALRYIITGISLQCIAGIAYTLLESIFSAEGSLVEVDFSYFQSGKSIVATILYTCLLAPVTEELLYRGFLMKALSRVGCRFAVVVSALIFGLAHGNISQMLLAVLVGLYLGKIDMRHNSLVPSMLVHIGINTSSMILSLGDTFLQSNTGALVYNLMVMVYYAIALLGLVFWFWKERKQPLPYPTQKQCTRNRIFWSSPWLLAAFALQIGIMIYNQVAM